MRRVVATLTLVLGFGDAAGASGQTAGPAATSELAAGDRWRLARVFSYQHRLPD